MPRKLRGAAKRKDHGPIQETTSTKRPAEEEIEGSTEVNKRKRQFQIQNHWVPISFHSSIATSVIVPDEGTMSDSQSPPPIMTTTPQDLEAGPKFRFKNIFTTPKALRQSPLPTLCWANSQEVWTVMLEKEEKYKRDHAMLERHSTLQARMRSILLDWLIEVCEVYRLHRETFYLATDFVDRYLSQTTDIPKQQLQLIGITSLFVAAKMEEIYPPRLSEFAYVTDGACTESEILEQELVILKELSWDLSPMTVNSWLNVYMQLVNVENIDEKENSFIVPQYSQYAFIQIARLLDLCFLDVNCLEYPYSVLAASAMYHITSEAVALSVSGYDWTDIATCVQWMSPFATTLREAGIVELRLFSSVSQDNAHNIQTHTVDLALLEKAQARQIKVESSSRASPDYSREIPGIITPPQSNSKTRTYE